MEKPSLRRRSGGLLLHPTSLPGPHGIGDLGPAAYRFVDFLAACGQSWWQMLPVGPAGAGNSPYSSPSAFAGCPLLISLEMLAKDGLLDPADLAGPADFPAGRVDYEAASRFKEPRLRKAFSRFTQKGRPSLWSRFQSFHRAHSAWLDDYALFCAIREARGVKSWTDWAPELRLREFRRWDRETLKSLGEASAYHQFIQYLFHRQWSKLRGYGSKKGVGFIGDVPIFVAQESADVWSHPELFQLDSQGRAAFVSGVPPDYFSETGQLWGNPLYRWDVLRARGYDWWLERLRQASGRFDAARLDHFIGFARYWEIPAGAPDARGGRWVPGPGADFFERVVAEVPELQIIAEDLGSVTPEVIALRDRFDFPGMRVLQFAFGDDRQAESFLPHSYPRRCVAYTGTHDNDTAVGWFNDPGTGPGSRAPAQAQRERENAMKYLGSGGREINWDMIRAVFKSTADTAVIPVQDLLGLGSSARMNLPGQEKGNWEWRLEEGMLTESIKARLRSLAEEALRLPEQSP